MGKWLVVALAALVGACGARSGLEVAERFDTADAGPVVAEPLDASIEEPPPPPPPPPIAAIHVVTGTHHACVLDESGAVRCWGNNRDGELGVDESVVESWTPLPLEALPRLRALAAGHAFTLGIDEAGRVWGWGSNAGGQLMLGAMLRSVPVRISPTDWPPASTVVAGDGYGCALLETRDVWCWGNASSIYRMRGEARDLFVPERVLGGARGLFGGGGHVCVVDSAGTAQCFGDNQYGEIDATLSREVALPTEPGGLGPVTEMALGLFHSCARRDGEVRCWGSNENGQSGASAEPSLPPTLVSGLPEPVGRVAVGWTASYAITRSGQAWCWGGNVYGQLGDGTRDDARSPVRVRFPAGVVVEQIDGGSNFGCAVDRAGRAWCWGENGRGQLGDGTEEDRLIPVPVLL